VLNDAIERGQDDNPALWYYFGRYYVMQNDPVGADSTFDLAEELAPRCAEDIAYYRRFLWFPTFNAAVESMQAGAYDSAKVLLHLAFTVWDRDNLTPFYLAGIYGAEPQLDSAVYYFKKVVDLGVPDSTRIDNYETAIFNVALISGMMGDWDSTVVWYDRYRSEVDAYDPQAMTGLAQALSNSGQTDRALLMYDSILGRASDMGSLELLQVGENLFRAERYAKSAQAFALGLEKNPYYRPGLYNLTNAYLALNNDEERSEEERQEAATNMEAAARRLVEVDPQSTESLDLLAASLQLQGLEDSTLAVLERREALAYEVVVETQYAVEGGYVVQGRVASLDEETPVSVPPISFEFLDQAGNVLAVQTLDPTTLDPSATAEFDMSAEGEGLIAMRYKVEG
jgi:Tfp pilus assembly protein PilF